MRPGVYLYHTLTKCEVAAAVRFVRAAARLAAEERLERIREKGRKRLVVAVVRLPAQRAPAVVLRERGTQDGAEGNH